MNLKEILLELQKTCDPLSDDLLNIVYDDQNLNAVEDAAEAYTKKIFDLVDRRFSFGGFLKLVHMYFINEIYDKEELAKEFNCSPILIGMALERLDYFLEKEFNLFMILKEYKKKYIQNLKEENGS